MADDRKAVLAEKLKRLDEKRARIEAELAGQPAKAEPKPKATKGSRSR